MNGPAVSQADDPQEQWHKVHAQLLKSVADAQAKLLAAQNEICDKVESATRNLGLVEQRLTARLYGIRADLLAKPPRQVEKLRPKRIFERPASKRKQC